MPIKQMTNTREFTQLSHHKLLQCMISFRLLQYIS